MATRELNYTERQFLIMAIRYLTGQCIEDEVWDWTYGGTMDDKMKFAQDVISKVETGA